MQFPPREPVEQVCDLDALIAQLTDRVDHATNDGQAPVRLVLKLSRRGCRVARGPRATLRAVPERIHSPRELLELVVQMLDLRLDHVDRHRAPRRPDREVGDSGTKIVQCNGEVAGRSASFAGPLGENRQIPRPVAVLG